ncbi:hypothetical protein GCM10007981_12510 [Thermocladium modestius]|uniref:Uncharacterized protein n=1 Tax=Thermocladium modestius TaxID=62609 RepID=A0A830GUF4_9CREN|nr:hypothetical protein [Thermocladium modestius]GGP21291.1 hypothetical protein GCM10007981_12510 [Thermocladium modestius]
MSIRQCIVMTLLSFLKAVSLDKLGVLCFIVDYLGGFEAFSWSLEGGSPISPDFIDAVEELRSSGAIRMSGATVSLGTEQPKLDCGWMADKVRRTAASVVSNYAHLDLEELINEAAFLYQDQQ